MIIKSTKFTVINSTACLNLENRISSTSNASDSAAPSAGLRVSAIQQKLKKLQERKNASWGTARDSVVSRIASAARCGTTSNATRAPCARAAETSSRRVVREAIAGGIQPQASPGTQQQSPPGGGWSSNCNQSVMASELPIPRL